MARRGVCGYAFKNESLGERRAVERGDVFFSRRIPGREPHMVNIPALGGGPVAFTDVNGNQREIPLSQLYFDDHGVINASNWPPYYSYKPIVDPWLDWLVAQGMLFAGTQAAGKAALVIGAREAGAAGNAVSVAFANPTPNADPKAANVDVTVTARQSWSLLTATSLESVLGTGPGTGSQPGLVFLTGPAPGAGTIPVEGTVKAAGNPAEFAIPKDGDGTAFTLEALFNSDADAADVALLTVSVANVDATRRSFSLIVGWTKSLKAVTLDDLSNKNPFAFLVSFAAPDGGLIGPPNAGTIALQGGADTSPTGELTATATALMG
jgi:hypothetical protein